MAIWLIFALMTGIAIGAVLWPLSRRSHALSGQVDERSFYEQRLAEISGDVSAGFIGNAEADAARAEAARRLLRETRNGRADLVDGESEYALRRRRAASAIALSTIPIITLAIYGAIGSPDTRSLPVDARMAMSSLGAAPAELVARMERHLATNPDDGAGWELLAPVYQRIGRSGDAVNAWANVVRLQGETPARLAAYAEALVATSNGVIESTSRDLFERAAKADPKAAMPKFYLAVAQAQDGDIEGARRAFEALLANAPANAPWRGAVEARIAGLSRLASAGPDGAGRVRSDREVARQELARSIADAPSDAQNAAIAGMVEGLASRLKENPDDPDGWRMLVRSYAMQGRKSDAAKALAEGILVLSARPQDVVHLETLGRELGLGRPMTERLEGNR